jgi:hypothetical protein
MHLHKENVDFVVLAEKRHLFKNNTLIVALPGVSLPPRV